VTGPEPFPKLSNFASEEERTMRNLIPFLTLALGLALAGNPASAAPVDRKALDIKLPTQQMIEKQSITNPLAADTNYILESNDGPASAAVTAVTSFAHQPDVPRNLTITPGSTTANVEACTVTVTGTNILGRTITEDFAFADNASSATTGSKAFKTVTSASWAASCEATPFQATWIIGIGEKLGVKKCMEKAGHLLFSTIDGAYESTRATVAADSDEVEKNTLDFNGTMDGTSDFEAFFIQNFRCGN
jgi:hypothetical protein